MSTTIQAQSPKNLPKKSPRSSNLRSPNSPNKTSPPPCRPSQQTKIGNKTSSQEPKTADKNNHQASPSEIASSTSQVVGGTNKAIKFGTTSTTFSQEARAIMAGTGSGSKSSQSLISALHDTYKNTEGGSGSKTLGAVSDALSPLGFANSVQGTQGALDNLRNGKTKEGIQGLVTSGGGAIGDGLGLAELGLKGASKSGNLAAAKLTGETAAKAGSIASKAGNVAKVAGKAGGVAGGAVAVAEGGFQVYDGLKEGDKAKAGRGAAKSIAGGMMVAGAATGNPVLAAAGGLTYAGVSIYENREAIGKAAKTSAKFVGNTAKTAVENNIKAAKAVGGAVAGGAEKLGNIADTVKDKAVDTAKDKVKTVGNTAKKVLGWLS